MDNSSQISIDPGFDHKVDGFATSPGLPATHYQGGDESSEVDGKDASEDPVDIKEEKAEWEGEGGSPPDAISSIDEDGDPPDRPAKGNARSELGLIQA